MAVLTSITLDSNGNNKSAPPNPATPEIVAASHPEIKRVMNIILFYVPNSIFLIIVF